MVSGTRRRWIVNPVTQKSTLHQLTFVTLTVSDCSQEFTGKDAYKQLLSPFLAWLRKTKGVNTYIWKAELQRNGQIHYHITLPDFIHYRELRTKWNEIQKKAGVIDRYRANQLEFHKDGFRLREELTRGENPWTAEAQRRAYDEGMKNDWQDPNSTDVHKVYKIKDVAAYLVKEIAKGMQNETSLGGKVWDCSENLSQAKYYTQTMEEKHFKFMELAVEERLCEKYQGEQFTIYRFKTFEPIEEYLLTEADLKNYQAWLYVLRDSIQYTDP